MPRGRLAIPKDDGEAIRLLAEYDIVQVRRGSGGRILEVDHVEFGWMKPEKMYRLKKLKEMQPLLEKAVEGGYRAKAALWSTTVSVHVLGTGLAVPVGIGMILGGLGSYAVHNALGKQPEAILDLLSIFLPFGEVWLLYSGAVAFAQEAGALAEQHTEAARDLASAAEDLARKHTEAARDLDIGGAIWSALNWLRGA